MKWIGQHIWDFISRFRSDVYLEATETGTIASGGNLGLDSNNKIVKAVSGSGDLTITNAGDNRVVTSTGGTGLEAEASLFFDAGSFSVSSATSTLPQMYLINDNADANGSQLWFNKLQNGADDDVLGVIKFVGDDEGGGAQSFVEIFGSISDATPGDESGKLEITVATNSNESRQALTATGLGTGSRVDVGLGYGAASLTTIAGTLTMGSTAFVNNSGVVQVATQGTIDHDSLANFVANEHLDWTGSTGSAIHRGNITQLDAITSNDVSFSSSASGKPVITLESTNTTKTTSAELKFLKDADNVEDNEQLGEIGFYGDNDAGTPEEIQYGKIVGSAADMTDGQEAGEIAIFVAELDGTLTAGLKIDGDTNADGEVDVSIGAGAASTTTISGDLVVTTKATIPSRKYELPSSTVGDYKGGDVYYYGDGTTVKGGIYYINGTNWTLADADAEASTSGLLAVALGTDPDVDGMLLRGFVTLLTEIEGTEAIGSPVYLSATDSGKATITVPASGDFVRVLGYSLHASDNQVYFNPDNTWVERA